MKRAASMASVIVLFCVGCGNPETPPAVPELLLGEKTSEIIGGTPTSENPAVLAILGGKPGEEAGALCTATVVAPTVLLTAAHCVHKDTVGEGAVFKAFTATDLNAEGVRETALNVKEVHAHPAWSASNLMAGHDIAVVILEKPLNVTPMPINRQALSDSLKGQPARIIGYGLNDGFGQTGAGIKRQATVKLSNWNDHFVQTGTFFGTTICSGDSGGPILMKLNGVDTVVGVNSYGFIFCLGEANSTRPDVNLDFVDQFVP